MEKMNPVVHFEMPAEDRKRMSDFYSKAFGWKIQQLGPETGNYVMAGTTLTDDQGMIQTKGAINGGFYDKPANGGAQHPSIMIAVDDIQEAMRKVTEGGGIVLGEPMPIPGVGVYVSFTDTEGNRASMMAPPADK